MNITTLTLVLAMAVGTVQAQVEPQPEPLKLPMDNSSTVSFMDCLPGEELNAWVLCERIEGSSYVTTEPLAFNNMFSVRIKSSVLSGGRHRRVSGEGIVYTSCGNFGYAFSEYCIDGVPIEVWESGRRAAEIEAVRGEVFLRTVEAIARMRGGWGPPSSGADGVASAPAE